MGKITGKEGTRFTGPARVFDSEEDMLAGLELLPVDDLLPVVLLYERVVKMLSGLIRTHGGTP